MQDISLTTKAGERTHLLSKWWMTDSAQAAMQRARERKQAQITKLKETFRAKREAQAREVNNWKVVQ
jgi:hypothetical protein